MSIVLRRKTAVGMETLCAEWFSQERPLLCLCSWWNGFGGREARFLKDYVHWKTGQEFWKRSGISCEKVCVSLAMVCFEWEACLAWAFLLIALPLPWFLSAILAALWHELCHMLAVWICGGSVSRICFGVTGIQMNARLRNRKREVLSVLAGPAGSLLLCSLFSWQPRLAVCGLIHGSYNLLPIRPLDGGRLLGFLLEQDRCDTGQRVQTVIEGIVLTVLFIGMLYHVEDRRAVLWLLFPLYGRIRRKIPCKRKQIRVQ